MWGGGLHPGCALLYTGLYIGCGERYFNDLLCNFLMPDNDLLFKSFFMLSSGITDFSFIDPVVIGRNLFGVIDKTFSGITGYIQDTLCAILDRVLDVFKGTTYFLLFFFPTSFQIKWIRSPSVDNGHKIVIAVIDCLYTGLNLFYFNMSEWRPSVCC